MPSPTENMTGGRVRVIAEAGVNHNGQIDLALRLVDAATKAGADVIKFQTFKADLLATENASKASYQIRQTGADASQFEMLKGLELDYEDFGRIAAVCADRGIEFLSTPFDLESLHFLARDLGLRTVKLGSGEVTNAPMLVEAARLGRDIILSTGMSTLAEVGEALGAIAFGYVGGSAEPSWQKFGEARKSAAGVDAICSRVAVLHCTSQYPAPANEANLRALDTLRAEFGTVVGLSDHAEGMVVSFAAVARGAQLIEKHLTLDRTMRGPDHAASLEPREFSDLVAGIRTIEGALGDGIKEPQPSELETRGVARRSLATLKPVSKGETFNNGNLGALRPGTAISPMRYWEWLGRTADRDYRAGELIGE